jgi:O-antigen/teichoic acid export membrane protein
MGGLFLIPRYGMTGAACATAASLTLVNLIKLAEVWILYRMVPFRRHTLRLFASGAAAAAVAVPVALGFLSPSYALEALVGVAVLFAVYAASVWRFGLTAEDRELVAIGRQRLGHRLGLGSGVAATK